MREFRLARVAGRYCVQWYEDDGRRRRRSLGTRDPDEARTRLAAFERQLAQPQGRETVTQLFAAYLADRQAEGKNTERMVHAWHAMADHFGHLLPEDITKADCRRYAAFRKERGTGQGTVWTELGILRSGLNWAAKSDRIAKAPYIWLPAKPRPKDRHLTRAEAKRLIKACDAPHVRLFVILALTTAARAGAILDLTWDRVDLERRRIRLDNPFRDVTRKGRATVPINATAYDALVLAREGALTPHVIEWGGDRVRSIKKGFAGAVKRARIEPCTPHTLRHTAAVWMAESGTPMHEISQYLGHNDSRTTERVYARYSPDHLRTAAGALEI